MLLGLRKHQYIGFSWSKGVTQKAKSGMYIDSHLEGCVLVQKHSCTPLGIVEASELEFKNISHMYCMGISHST